MAFFELARIVWETYRKIRFTAKLIEFVFGIIYKLRNKKRR